MSFAVRNLSVLAYAQGFTLWHYKGGAGALADVSADGFFDEAADLLAPGDMVMISAADGGRVKLLVHLPRVARRAGRGRVVPLLRRQRHFDPVRALRAHVRPQDRHSVAPSCQGAL